MSTRQVKRKRRHAFHSLLPFFVIVASSSFTATASSTTPAKGAALATTATSPIANWGPSWAASSAQGTIVSIPCCYDSNNNNNSSSNIVSSKLAAAEEHYNDRNDESIAARTQLAAASSSKTTYSSSPTAIILLFQSPRPKQIQQQQQQPPNRKSFTSANDVSKTTVIHPAGLRLIPYQRSSSLMFRWVTFLLPQYHQHHQRASDATSAVAVSCMTGLVSDVDHLSSCLQQYAETHRFVYEYDDYTALDHHNNDADDNDNDDDEKEILETTSQYVSGTSIASRLGQRLSLLSVVQKLARLLREATLWQGERPFGVQALLVGPNPQADSSGKPVNTGGACPLDVITLDPSGGYRHWGSRATAIGRGAAQVRKQLYERLLADTKQSLNHDSRLIDRHPTTAQTPLTALRVALEALLCADGVDIRAAGTDGIGSSGEKHFVYEAVLIRSMMGGSSPQQLWIETIDPEQIQEIQRNILQQPSAVSPAPVSSNQ